MVARRAHNPKVDGSNPSSATSGYGEIGRHNGLKIRGLKKAFQFESGYPHHYIWKLDRVGLL